MKPDATDFLKPARRAFPYAIKLANALGVQLLIVHVVKGVPDTSDYPLGGRSLHGRKTAALLELVRMVRVATERGVVSQLRLLVGEPGISICELAASLNVRLILTGTHGRTGWDLLKVGSTARGVLRAAPCPVLTVGPVVVGDPPPLPNRLPLRHILVASDFSPLANGAAEHAAAFADDLKGDLCFVHVLQHGRDGSVRGSPTLVRHKLQKLARESMRADMSCRVRCVSGDPVERILSEARRCGADLIAMGTHGRSGLAWCSGV